MKTREALRRLTEITASQWGMVTAAQAASQGISRLQLSRFTEHGHLIRLTQGVYKDAGAPETPFDEIRAAWLSTNPNLLGEQRIKNLTEEVAVASSSAALLHGIGDLWTDRHEFVSPLRRQTQREEIRYRQRKLSHQDVTLVEGLPVMTLERTIADLVENIGDLSLAADALRDASTQRGLDEARLEALLDPLATRNGFQKNNGAALLEKLQESAGTDEQSLAERILADKSLTLRVLTNSLSEEYFKSLTTSPALRQSLESLNYSVTKDFQKSFSAQRQPIQDALKGAINQVEPSQIVQGFSRQLIDRGLMQGDRGQVSERPDDFQKF